MLDNITSIMLYNDVISITLSYVVISNDLLHYYIISMLHHDIISVMILTTLQYHFCNITPWHNILQFPPHYIIISTTLYHNITSIMLHHNIPAIIFIILHYVMMQSLFCCHGDISEHYIKALFTSLQYPISILNLSHYIMM